MVTGGNRGQPQHLVGIEGPADRIHEVIPGVFNPALAGGAWGFTHKNSEQLFNKSIHRQKGESMTHKHIFEWQFYKRIVKDNLINRVWFADRVKNYHTCLVCGKKFLEIKGELGG